MRIRHVLGLLALCVLPATLAAQGSCPALQAGSTVRLHAPSGGTYTLPQSVRSTDTAIILPPVGRAVPAPLPCADLERVQLHTGASRSRSTLQGAGIGLVVGAALGAGLFYATYEEDDSGWDIVSRSEAAGIGAFVAGGTGLVIGGVVGYLRAPSEWRDVPMTSRAARVPAEGLRIAPAAGTQVAVSYTLTF